MLDFFRIENARLYREISSITSTTACRLNAAPNEDETMCFCKPKIKLKYSKLNYVSVFSRFYRVRA